MTQQSDLSLMLCFDYRQLRSEEQDRLWRDDNSWAVQEKFNGVRILLSFVKGQGVFARTRKGHQVQDRLLFESCVPDFDACVDTEAIVFKPIDTREYTDKGTITRSSLHSTTALLMMEPNTAKLLQQDQDAAIKFQVFDITQWHGQDLKQKVLCERLSY